MAANHKKLVESYRLDGARTIAGLKAAIEARELKPTEFDFGKLFVECFGWHEFVACKEGKQLAHDVFKRVSEGDAGVTTAAFQNISGQITTPVIATARWPRRHNVTSPITYSGNASHHFPSPARWAVWSMRFPTKWNVLPTPPGG